MEEVARREGERSGFLDFFIVLVQHQSIGFVLMEHASD